MELEELLDSHINKNHLSAATERTYRTAITIFIRDTGIRVISDITIESIESWKQQVLSRASGSTWNNYHRHLKALFEAAIRKNIIFVPNPFKQVAQIRNPIEREKVCSITVIKGAIRSLESGNINIAPEWFWVAVIRMFYYTGMRRRQLVGLKWEDINYQEKTLLMSSAHSKTRKQWYIPITVDVHRILITILNETRKVLGTTPGAAAQIFNVTLFNEQFSGTEMTGEQLTGMFRKIRNAGYSLSPHKLRHTMATEICNINDVGEASVTLRTLQVQLGHSDISTTAKYIRPSIKAQVSMLHQLKTV